MINNMKRVISLSLVVVFAMVLLTGCKKDKGNPPVLPPEESMYVDFANFSAAKGDPGAFKGIENSNWEFAALVAGYFKSVAAVTLIIPITSFQLAIDQTPVWVDDKTWQWSYSATVGPSTYKARLTGQIRSTDVVWKMYITKEGAGAFAEFLWFEGTSKLDGKGGSWTLNYSSAFQEPVLKIDWEGTGTTVTKVKYTYVRDKKDDRTTDPFKNSYIEYGKLTGTFNSYYTINYYNGAAFADMNVEWHSTVHNGRVKCSPFFGDALWHCWNANLVNEVCP